MFAAQCHQVFNAVSVFTSTHAPCLNVVYIICHRTAYLTWDKVTGRISKMLEINLRVALHGCKVCGIIIIIFKNVENFLLKYLHRYKKLYYICGMEQYNLTSIQSGTIVKTIKAADFDSAKKYFDSLGKDTDTDYFIESQQERNFYDQLQKRII